MVLPYKIKGQLAGNDEYIEQEFEKWWSVTLKKQISQTALIKADRGTKPFFNFRLWRWFDLMAKYAEFN